MLTRRHLLAAPFLPGLARAAARPNVIVIVSDDHGWGDVGFHGCTDIPTPNLDALAKSGVRFTQGLVSHPFCSPTRAGLLTGRYQQRFGHENNPRYDPQDATAGLPLTETTLPQTLRAAGYKTGIVGKWHLGAIPKMHPLARGFEEQFGFIGGGHDYFKAGGPGEKREYLIPIERNGQPVVEQEYLTDAFSREAEGFVRRHRADPFFLYLTYNAPHTPQQVSEKYLQRFTSIADEKRRNYAAMLSAVDDGVGRLLKALAETKNEENTLVFFLSDNGGPVGVNGSTNGPLRGAKGQVYEGGIRVPFVARWKGRLPAGVEYKQPVISLDIFPTACAAAGVKPPAGRDGANLLPYLEGKAKGAPHQRLFWRTGGGATWAVREGNLKMVKAAQAEPALYDLDTDIGEARDLAAERPQVAQRLRTAFEDWNEQLISPLFESPQAARKKQ